MFTGSSFHYVCNTCFWGDPLVLLLSDLTPVDISTFKIYLYNLGQPYTRHFSCWDQVQEGKVLRLILPQAGWYKHVEFGGWHIFFVASDWQGFTLRTVGLQWQDCETVKPMQQKTKAHHGCIPWCHALRDLWRSFLGLLTEYIEAPFLDVFRKRSLI